MPHRAPAREAAGRDPRRAPSRRCRQPVAPCIIPGSPMPTRLFVFVVFLAALVPLWNAIDRPDHALDGWLFTAYGFAFAILAAYRLHIAESERRLINRRLVLVVRGAHSPRLVRGA